MTLSILTYNTLFAGRDGADDRRARSQVDVICKLKPDVFLMQEAKGFEADGAALLHALEAKIGMRGFLAVAPRTGQNTAVFIRGPLRPISFEADGANFHHALATLKVLVPGWPRPLSLISAHLCPNGPEIRRREAAHLAVRAAQESLAILAGDFNSVSPHDPDPDDFHDLPLHHRTRYLADDLLSVDRSVVARLEASGWIDVGHKLDVSKTPTVPTAGFVGTEFATMRCDYVMATSPMAAAVAQYEVIRTNETDTSSDHYPVFVSFGSPG